MTLYGWVIEYGRGMDGAPMVVFMAAAKHDAAAALDMAARLHGVLREIFVGVPC